VQDRVAALLRVIGSVGNLSLLTTGDYYHESQNKMMENEMVTGQGCGMGIGGCNGVCPAAAGHSLFPLFSCPCGLRIVRCMDPSQVTDLLSRAHTCLWEREGLLLSYHGFRLCPDRLIGSEDRWRFKHHIEAWPQVWGLGVQVWTGTWNPWQEWNELVSFVPGVQARRVFFEVPS
jgi:hypothetical protein